MKRENGTEGEGKKMAVWGIGAYNPKNNEDKAKQFVEKGKIVEEGNHEMLLRKGGKYEEFWTKQN